VPCANIEIHFYIFYSLSFYAFVEKQFLQNCKVNFEK